MKKHFLGLSILLFFLSALPVFAGAPLDAVEANVTQVLDVLRDPQLKAESAEEIKKEKLRVIYEQMFDEVNFPGGPWGSIGTS